MKIINPRATLTLAACIVVLAVSFTIIAIPTAKQAPEPRALTTDIPF